MDRRTPLTRAEILSGIARLSPWFHSIDLGGGVFTKSASIAGEPLDHPRRTWRTIGECLPHDLQGKSVLDVGCNAGFYCVAAKQRGATRVMGIDVNRLHIRQASFVRRVLGLDIELRRASVYQLGAADWGQFDVVLALGLIYHCKHLVLALENLWQVTRGLLVIETAVYPQAKLRKPFRHAAVGAAHSVHTLGYVENPPGTFEAAFNWFLPGVGALEALLRNLGVKTPEVHSVEGDRAVFLCRKGEGLPDSRGASQLSAQLTLLEGVAEARRGAAVSYCLKVENVGGAIWLAGSHGGPLRGAVNLGAHLFTAEGDEVEWDWGRAVLETDLAPGKATELTIHLRAPDAPGRYRVEIDMVSEGVAWFEDLGSSGLREDLTVL